MDPQGIIRHSACNDFGIGRSVQETLRLVQALQFHDKHGEVCGVDWQEGSKGIKVSTREPFNLDEISP